MVQTTAFSFPCSAEPCSASAQRAAQDSADANIQRSMPSSRLTSIRSHTSYRFHRGRQCKLEPGAIDKHSALPAVQCLSLRGSDVKNLRIDQLPVVVPVAWTKGVAAKQIVEGTIGCIRGTQAA